MTTMMGLSLNGRRVLMVGGGAVTARRIGRFIADGALVRVVAPQLHAETADAIAAGEVEWLARDFRPADLDDAWFVHTATGVPAVDRTIGELCERRRLFCINAGDSTRTGARMVASGGVDDVKIGVCSDVGADPRRAGRVRDAIDRMLAEGTLPVRQRRRSGIGRVDLVGGGPGPLDLMTLRAHRLIAAADMLVVDRLGPADEVRELIEADVEVIDVGKRPGDHPIPQDAINALLVAHALAGKRVVRLKGGDPFVFGRGGEEVLACRAAGVPVDVVPGISSAIAVPQAAGIPVTHRGTSAAVHIINGQGPVNATTIRSMADPEVTTVVLMGVAALARLVEAARRGGVPDELPVAIIERGWTANQRTTHSTLANVVEHARAAHVHNPAVIVFGDVAQAGLLVPGAVPAEASAR